MEGIERKMQLALPMLLEACSSLQRAAAGSDVACFTSFESVVSKTSFSSESNGCCMVM